MRAVGAGDRLRVMESLLAQAHSVSLTLVIMHQTI
jgi:hypothetical protein